MYCVCVYGGKFFKMCICMHCVCGVVVCWWGFMYYMVGVTGQLLVLVLTFHLVWDKISVAFYCALYPKQAGQGASCGGRSGEGVRLYLWSHHGNVGFTDPPHHVGLLIWQILILMLMQQVHLHTEPLLPNEIAENVYFGLGSSWKLHRQPDVVVLHS